MIPVLCLITDRRRLGLDLDGLVDRIAAAARAGVHLVQIRERDLDGAALLQVAEGAVQAVRGTRTRVLVNDRVDVALAAGAHGVHLRSDSLPASRLRRIVPAAFLVGRSVHSPGEAARVSVEGGLDYLIFGTLFATDSKPGRTAAGVVALAEAAAATSLPVLAVGGVTRATAGVIAGAGAAGLAAVGLFAEPDAARLQTIVRDVIAAFDTPGAVP